MRISYPRILSAVRRAQDALKRTLDGLDPVNWREGDLGYANEQIGHCEEYLLEATDLIERRRLELHTGRAQHLNSDGRGGRPTVGE